MDKAKIVNLIGIILYANKQYKNNGYYNHINFEIVKKVKSKKKKNKNKKTKKQTKQKKLCIVSQG